MRQPVTGARLWSEAGTFAALEAAARFRHRLVLIHPFANGNGRHARIAANVDLDKCFGHPR